MDLKAGNLLSELSTAVTSSNVDKGKDVLAQLKILMLDFPPNLSASPQLLDVAISTYENGILLSLHDDDGLGDMDSFARNMTQLKPLYAMSPITPADDAKFQKKCHVLGLNLMNLLVENNLSEFHSELEELVTQPEAMTSSKYITFPISLERQLMVGSYDEILLSLTTESSMPDKSYGTFMENLLTTVRDSIGDCIEMSYKTMKLVDAAKMMKYDSVKELLEYVEEMRGSASESSGSDWIIEDDELCFQPPETGKKASDIPSMKLIEQSLSYATELERIV
mmetsp:Transcript_45754/g.53548  ORF Transcript_45754/g.53548 Transcript_45754/m.53548 type:complete len:280 (-) Transcript_45754:144-983(-)|eukprot:CAMPEP_0194377256 /NCGR_PEP_ID=MMETSP0174-20130528/30183_1 /TAXON_ID=216777 /ORGANISM="Proboscia alata, Strain PI-D3" /LENGTH=279 /DNA_ID=CAMNT_0039158495 /DNA_START=93 /DNA_END=932 /DNA_ORIENTATION=+